MGSEEEQAFDVKTVFCAKTEEFSNWQSNLELDVPRAGDLGEQTMKSFTVGKGWNTRTELDVEGGHFRSKI